MILCGQLSTHASRQCDMELRQDTYNMCGQLPTYVDSCSEVNVISYHIDAVIGQLSSYSSNIIWNYTASVLDKYQIWHCDCGELSTHSVNMVCNWIAFGQISIMSG